MKILFTCFFLYVFFRSQKWGFKRGARKQIWGYLRKKAFFLRYPGFLRCSLHPPEKGEKGRFRPISRKGGQTPLKPPFVTPPFAAAPQMLRRSPCKSMAKLRAANSADNHLPVALAVAVTSYLGRTPQYRWNFPEEALEKERFLGFPSRVRLGSPKPYNSGKCKVLIFLQVWSFDSHALRILSADDSGRFLQNPREVVQFVSGQNVQSVRVKRSDLQKD